MKHTLFDGNIKKLRSGIPIKLEPHDCAYFVSLFARFEENISFFMSVKDKMVTLSTVEPSRESSFSEKREAERAKYCGMSIDELLQAGERQ